MEHNSPKKADLENHILQFFLEKWDRREFHHILPKIGIERQIVGKFVRVNEIKQKIMTYP